MKSSTLTNSVLIELRVFSFCFVEADIGKPFPIQRPPPERPRIFGWAPYDPYIHHFNTPVLFAPIVKGSFIVPLICFIRCASLDKSSSFGSLTLVVRYEIAGPVSGLALFVTNNIFATMLWNLLAFFLQSSITVKKLRVLHCSWFLFPSSKFSRRPIMFP